VSVDASAPADSGIGIRGLNHFTMPVCDRYVAARFYGTIFTCERKWPH
jgi:hypothetical protein